MVGKPLGVKYSGPHTWDESGDRDWHFLGAAAAAPEGLERGWFASNASQAEKDSPEHAICASRFSKTGLCFPLSWALRYKSVSAVNVTDRYAATAPPADINLTATQALRISFLNWLKR